MDPEATPDPVVAVFMDEHEQRQDQNEVRQICRKQADDALHAALDHEVRSTSIT